MANLPGGGGTALLSTDLLILNRTESTGPVTYKIDVETLVENVLFVLQGGEIDTLPPSPIDPDAGNGLLAVNDLIDASTVKYIEDHDTGLVKMVSTYSGSSSVPVGTKSLNDGTMWMLQYSTSQGEFILSDPNEAFDNAGIRSVDVLDDLRDVSTAGATVVLNDTILLATGTTTDTPGNTVTLYTPQSFTETLNDIISNGGNGGGIDLELNFEDLTDYSGTRLEYNAGYNPGLPASSTNCKYVDSGSTILDDDTFVYIKDATIMIVGATVADSEKWYAVGSEDLAGGDEIVAEKLPIAEIDDTALGRDPSPGDSFRLGAVRVAKYRETTAGFDAAKGHDVINAITGNTPTNIGITPTGVIYSEIPQTLSFRDTIDITKAGGATDYGSAVETFSDGSAVPVGAAQPGGPGYFLTPTDPFTEPQTGDFYVVRFIDGGSGTEDLGGQKTLAWRSGTGAGIDNVGSNPTVGNGDIVAWSGSRWAVIGTVNTDTIASDLQNVTDRGNHTTNSIYLDGTSIDSGLRVGAPSRITGGPTPATPDTGRVEAADLAVNNIDFDYFPMLN